MNPLVQSCLALILFAPWFVILGGLFWVYPRGVKSPLYRLFDLTALSTALTAAAGGMEWGMAHADTHAGAIWKQVLATSIAYGVFLGVLTIALALRHSAPRQGRGGLVPSAHQGPPHR